MTGRYNNLRTLLLSLIVGLAQARESRSDQIYWADYNAGTVQRANIDGTGTQTLVTGLVGPIGLALDLPAGQMYFSNFPGNILRSNLDGTGVQTVTSGQPAPVHSLTLDLSDGKIYWTEDSIGKIFSANLDGTNMQTVVTGQNYPSAIALNLQAGKIYWTDYHGGDIRSANLNGTNVQTLVSGLDTPAGIALDIASGHMYWTSNHGLDVFRANLDGTGAQVLLSAVWGLTDIALDLNAGKMYFGAAPTPPSVIGEIFSANLDGTGLQVQFPGLGSPTGLSIASVPEPSSLMLVCVGLATAVVFGRRRWASAPIAGRLKSRMVRETAVCGSHESQESHRFYG
jgi:hypothetical protein